MHNQIWLHILTLLFGFDKVILQSECLSALRVDFSLDQSNRNSASSLTNSDTGDS